MKNFLTTLLVFGILAALNTGCKDKPVASGDAAESATASDQKNGKGAPGDAEHMARQLKDKPSSSDEQLAAQFSRIGVTLSAEQLAQVAEVAGKYDLMNAPDRETRRKMKNDFQMEVINTILTPEQKETALSVMEERKNSRQ